MIKNYQKIDQRNDGKVEVIDVKLNNRKTKKIGDSNKKDDKKIKIDQSISENIENKLIKSKNLERNNNLKVKNNSRFKMPDRRKGYIQKAQIGS